MLSALAGFVSAQFVTMTRLETSYYIVMVGAIVVAKKAEENAALIVATTAPAVAAATVASSRYGSGTAADRSASGQRFTLSAPTQVQLGRAQS